MIQQWPQEPILYPSRWPAVAIVVAGTVTVIALCVCGLLGWKLAGQRQTQEMQQRESGRRHTELAQARDAHVAGVQAHDAAKAFVLLMTNLDYQDFDRNVAAISENSTGEFKDKYSKSSAQLRQIIVDNKAKATGVVVDSAIQSEAVDKVTMLFFIDQSVTNLALPEPRLDRSRAVITMEKVDGRWLASQVDLP